VAEQGAFAAREDSGHPAPALGQAVVADGVDPLVDHMERRRCDEAIDSPGGKAHLQQVAARDDPVLAGSEGGDGSQSLLTVAEFAPNSVVNSPSNPHAGRLASGHARMARET
jgi:hypothetical protein